MKRQERLQFHADVDYYKPRDPDARGIGQASDFPRTIDVSFGPKTPGDQTISGKWPSGVLPPPTPDELLPHRLFK